MDIFEAIKKRYSCRVYQNKPVEAEKLNAILNAARLAPSARNFQDWRFVVVTDTNTRKALVAACNNQAFIGQAPVVLACCSTMQYLMRCSQPAGPIDVAIAMEHIALAATSFGLATCWVGSFYPEQIRNILQIPTHISVIELMTLGYPADQPNEPKRLALDQIVCRERWTF